jgi:hypothetical protein
MELKPKASCLVWTAADRFYVHAQDFLFAELVKPATILASSERAIWKKNQQIEV